MSLIPVPGTPGAFAIPGLGKTIKLTEWSEQDIFDTWVLPATAQLQVVNELRFYTNVDGKNPIDTNLTTNSKMPARHSAIVLKVGVFVPPKWGASTPELADQMAIYQEATFELLKNRKTQVEETHLWGLATGYGFVGYGIDFGGPAVTVAPGSNGVASPSAIPPLLVPFELNDDDDFQGRLRFHASAAAATIAGVTAAWTSHTLAQDTPIMVALHGFVKSPATR